MHGGASTGPRTAEGLHKARTAHGANRAEMRELREKHHC